MVITSHFKEIVLYARYKINLFAFWNSFLYNEKLNLKGRYKYSIQKIRKVFLKKNYFFNDVNLERIEANIPFIGFTSVLRPLKES